VRRARSVHRLARRALSPAISMRGDAFVQSIAQLAPRKPPSPALLTRRGLAAGVEVLGDRAQLPVCVDIMSQRYPTSGECAADFVAAEAFTNVAKMRAPRRAPDRDRRDRPTWAHDRRRRRWRRDVVAWQRAGRHARPRRALWLAPSSSTVPRRGHPHPRRDPPDATSQSRAAWSANAAYP